MVSHPQHGAAHLAIPTPPHPTFPGQPGLETPDIVIRRRRRAEPPADPRYAAAQDALGEGDVDRAVAEYQKLVDANPADAEAAAGLAMAKVLQRTRGVDLTAAREAAAANPDDVDAQTLVADLEAVVAERCRRLEAAVIKPHTDFHWWPRPATRN